MPALEYRRAVELRSDGRVLLGRAIPYGQWAEIGRFRERVEPGAFARTLRARDDVLLLADHDLGRVLARTANRSLVLDDQADGLHFRAELAQFTAADDVLAQAKAGLLSGASIGFYVRDGGEQWNAAGNERTLRDLELVEVSAVSSFPAYDGTSIAARSRRFSAGEIARRRRRRQLAGL